MDGGLRRRRAGAALRLWTAVALAAAAAGPALRAAAQEATGTAARRAEIPGKDLGPLRTPVPPPGDPGTVEPEPAGGLCVRLRGVLPGTAPVARVVPLSHSARPWLFRVPVAFWARTVRDGGACWEALPQGSYAVYLDWPELAAAGNSPARVGDVEVEAGRWSGLEVRAPGGTGGAAEAAQPTGGPATLRLLLHADAAPAAAPLRAWILEPARGRATPVPYTLEDGGGPGRMLSVAAPPRPGAALALTSPGWLAGPVLDPPESAAAVPEVRARKVGWAMGRLEVGPRRVSHGVALATPCGGVRPGEPPMPVPVEVSPDAEVAVPVPWPCSDLELRLPGFAPLERRSVRVGPAGTADLGAVAPRPGASILVRVVDADSGMPVSGAEVEAVPEREVGRALARRRDGRAGWAPACLADEEGWCRIAALSRGTYRLVGGAPGYAPAVGDPIRVGGPRMYEVEPLRLARPGELTVRVGEDLPGGDPELVLTPVMACRPWFEAARYVPVQPGGTVTVDALSPVSWRVELSAAAPPDGRFIVDAEEVAVPPGDRVEVELGTGALEVEGTVSLRGEPLKARLRFQPQVREVAADADVAVPARSDPAGRFRARLPGEGAYSARVAAEEPPVDTDVDGVVVREGEPVRIEVPAGRIEGTVVDAEGTPLPGARVEAMSGRARATGGFVRVSRVGAGPDGSFLLDGLPPGEWSLQAWAPAGRARSSPLRVALPEDGTVSGVVLRVRDPGRVALRVVDARGGPVAGAKVEVWPMALDGAAGPAVVRVTDADGRVELERSQGAANIQVVAPGLGVDVFVRRLDTDLDLQLPPAPGTLVVRRTGEGGAPRRWLVLAKGSGGLLMAGEGPEGSLWVQPEPGVWVVPRLAPGTWTVLEVEPGYHPELLRAAVRGDAAALLAAATVEVPAGGVVEVAMGGDPGAGGGAAAGAAG